MMDKLLQEPVASVATLQKGSNNLKKDRTRVYPQKRLRDGSSDMGTSSRDGN